MAQLCWSTEFRKWKNSLKRQCKKLSMAEGNSYKEPVVFLLAYVFLLHFSHCEMVCDLGWCESRAFSIWREPLQPLRIKELFTSFLSSSLSGSHVLGRTESWFLMCQFTETQAYLRYCQHWCCYLQDFLMFSTAINTSEIHISSHMLPFQIITPRLLKGWILARVAQFFISQFPL